MRKQALHSIVRQAGTIRVHLAPLLIIIGAAMAANDFEVEQMVEMLDAEEEEDASEMASSMD